MKDTPLSVLADVERRIRHQAKAAAVGSMEWRAHMADLAHIEAVRMDLLRPAGDDAETYWR